MKVRATRRDLEMKRGQPHTGQPVNHGFTTILPRFYHDLAAKS